MKKVLREGSLCFLSGDLLTSAFYLWIGNDFAHFMLKVISTLIIGIIGGIAGLAGKDLYPVLKAYIKRKIKSFIHRRIKNKSNPKI